MSKRHPRSPAQTAQWRHLGLRGNAAMIKANCEAVIAATTPTHEAKFVASQIILLAVRLAEELKTQLPIKE